MAQLFYGLAHFVQRAERFVCRQCFAPIPLVGYFLKSTAAALASIRRFLNMRVRPRRIALAILALLPFNFVAPLVALYAVVAGRDPEETGFGLLAALNIFFSALALMKYGVDLRDLANAAYEAFRGLGPSHSTSPALYRI